MVVCNSAVKQESLLPIFLGRLCTLLSPSNHHHNFPAAMNDRHSGKINALCIGGDISTWDITGAPLSY